MYHIEMSSYRRVTKICTSTDKQVSIDSGIEARHVSVHECTMNSRAFSNGIQHYPI